MSEVRCGTCAHFRGVFPELNLGECARLEFRVLGDAAHIHAGIVSDANMERFVVSPSFGCVYHDPRDDEEGEGERVMSRGEVGGYLRTRHRVEDACDTEAWLTANQVKARIQHAPPLALSTVREYLAGLTRVGRLERKWGRSGVTGYHAYHYRRVW